MALTLSHIQLLHMCRYIFVSAIITIVCLYVSLTLQIKQKFYDNVKCDFTVPNEALKVNITAK